MVSPRFSTSIRLSLPSFPARRTSASPRLFPVAVAAAVIVAVAASVMALTPAHAAAAATVAVPQKPSPQSKPAGKPAAPAATAPASHKASTNKSGMPRVGSKAPAFSLLDADGKEKRSLSEFAARPVTLMFLCGCEACAKLSQEWASLQRGGAFMLAPELACFQDAAASPATAASPAQKGRGATAVATASSLSPVTVIVYAGTAAELKNLVAVSGLDPTQTVLLPDATLSVTTGIYHGEPCPRVFVIDREGIVRYVNDNKDDQPQKAEAIVIASRALTALRDAAMSAPRVAPAPLPGDAEQTKPAQMPAKKTFAKP